MTSRQKAGFTLIELLVYMGLLASIVIIAGHAFSDSTKFRVRTQNILKASQESENVGMLLKSDISQMGSKNSKEAGDAITPNGEKRGDKFGMVRTAVYMDPNNADLSKRDYSSFEVCTLGETNCDAFVADPDDAQYAVQHADDDAAVEELPKAGDYSSLFFRYVRYDDQGHYKAVEEAHWYVEAGVLKRTCRTIAGDNSVCGDSSQTRDVAKAHAVEIATKVKRFQVTPVTPGDYEQLFPSAGGETFSLIPRKGAGYENVNVSNELGEVGASGTGQKIGGSSGPFFSNWTNDPGPANDHLLPEANRKVNQLIAANPVNNPVASWSTYCENQGGKFQLVPDVEYEISFEMALPPSTSDKSLLFIPGRDHMSVGFRRFATGNPPQIDGKALIEDFMFFPPLDAKYGDGKRTMRFTVPETIDGVCIAFTFAFYSPLASQGAITINNLRLRKLPYIPDNNLAVGAVPVEDKENVRLMRVLLEVARGGKNGKKGETNTVILVIPTPSNGRSD